MRKLRRFLAVSLIVSIAGAGLPQPAQAAMLSTENALTNASAAASAARERIGSLLERADVRAKLEARGVNPADVQARVAALTDDEAAQVAAQIDQAPAGGDALGVIVFIFVLLLITDILGFTKIFPFTRSIR